MLSWKKLIYSGLLLVTQICVSMAGIVIVFDGDGQKNSLVLPYKVFDKTFKGNANIVSVEVLS